MVTNKTIKTIPENRNYVKALLVLKGISIKEIAKELGVSHAAVSRVVYGHTISRKIRQAIADKLRMPYDKLWGK